MGDVYKGAIIGQFRVYLRAFGGWLRWYDWEKIEDILWV